MRSTTTSVLVPPLTTHHPHTTILIATATTSLNLALDINNNSVVKEEVTTASATTIKAGEKKSHAVTLNADDHASSNTLMTHSGVHIGKDSVDTRHLIPIQLCGGASEAFANPVPLFYHLDLRVEAVDVGLHAGVSSFGRRALQNHTFKEDSRRTVAVVATDAENYGTRELHGVVGLATRRLCGARPVKLRDERSRRCIATAQLPSPVRLDVSKPLDHRRDKGRVHRDRPGVHTRTLSARPYACC